MKHLNKILLTLPLLTLTSCYSVGPPVPAGKWIGPAYKKQVIPIVKDEYTVHMTARSKAFTDSVTRSEFLEKVDYSECREFPVTAPSWGKEELWCLYRDHEVQFHKERPVSYDMWVQTHEIKNDVQNDGVKKMSLLNAIFSGGSDRYATYDY